MKLLEVAGKKYTVIRKSDSKKLFSDSKEACLRFIRGFDLASPKYVDLRLISPNGEEDQYWKKE